MLNYSSTTGEANEAPMAFYIVLIADRIGPNPSELQELIFLRYRKSLHVRNRGLKA